ncbi:hypothetical protein NPS01_00050 [Nocardioides psychrotolerans]|uniref:Uncharacterized membrane protein YczE n=1 Tax=Nocardioides psychrotolerans TaxID=1005945 RepID=A0A1I3C0Q5_9ACTN|nr:hypothetical protein [Nocardioides psychrotolerans]GEP36342.1 hypothetical protein NPS01_00050 [Nocardioides psychrotolerans]SFH68198.1 Uncharacterized membrane protein YczE [Nocardioides psychrotolerans]
MLTVVTRLVVSCTVLGIGVGLLLTAALGSDGYSTMINGISLALELDFWIVNLAVGIVLVGVAWARGLRPGVGTVVQPVVVGAVVTAVLAVLEQPEQWWARAALLAISLPVVAIGVAGYLAEGAGAGPTEAAAIALDPPVPFRWSYGLVQGGGAVIGWLCGAAVGPGTLLVIVLLGPMVSWVSTLARAQPARH